MQGTRGGVCNDVINGILQQYIVYLNGYKPNKEHPVPWRKLELINDTRVNGVCKMRINKAGLQFI
jgi:hypothetical protein